MKRINKMKTNKNKIESLPVQKEIFIDLEISPQESMTYGPFYEASILSVIREPHLFCFSYGNVNGGPIKVISLTDYPLYKRDPHNDREVVKELYKVISSADRIVAHNIAFDMRIAKARFIKHGLPPIKPIPTICTLKMARKVASFPSNSLKELALFLGVTHKMETSKYLWQKIYIEKDLKAWKEMRKYNKIDTEVGIAIYKILRGWNGRVLQDLYVLALCKGCGSDDVQFRGPTRTKRNGKRFQCNKCLQWGHVFINS